MILIRISFIIFFCVFYFLFLFIFPPTSTSSFCESMLSPPLNFNRQRTHNDARQNHWPQKKMSMYTRLCKHNNAILCINRKTIASYSHQKYTERIKWSWSYSIGSIVRSCNKCSCIKRKKSSIFGNGRWSVGCRNGCLL